MNLGSLVIESRNKFLKCLRISLSLSFIESTLKPKQQEHIMSSVRPSKYLFKPLEDFLNVNFNVLYSLPLKMPSPSAIFLK